MKSVPAAMTWEVLSRGRWGLLAAAPATIAFPVLILAALRREATLDPEDHAMLLMHVMLLQASMVAFAMTVLVAQGPMRRLFALPLRTSELVLWRMAPAMALVAIESVLCTTLLNAVFDVNWPVWGPAMYLAVEVAAIQAVIWLTDRSGWIVFGLTAAIAPCGLWFKSRYGPMFGQPTHFWRGVTAAEGLTLAAAAAVAYWVGVKAMARNRRGEPPLSLGLVAWLAPFFDGKPRPEPAFVDPLQAHGWYEWRRRGGAMPTAVTFIILASLTIWLFGSRDVNDLTEMALAGAFMLPMVAVLGGLIAGNVGPHDGDLQMGYFLAARPMTDVELARVSLQTAARSVALSCMIWGTAAAAALGLLAAVGRLPSPLTTDGVAWRHIAASLVGTWIVYAVIMCGGLAGRAKAMSIVVCTVLVGLVLVTVGGSLALSPTALAQLNRALAAAAGVGLVFLTSSLMTAARRRGMISTTTLAAAGLAWILLDAVIWFAAINQDVGFWPGYLLLAGTASLAVLPLAAAPLAIMVNRHR